jgi:hypothetical protein
MVRITTTTTTVDGTTTTTYLRQEGNRTCTLHVVEHANGTRSAHGMLAHVETGYEIEIEITADAAEEWILRAGLE